MRPGRAGPDRTLTAVGAERKGGRIPWLAAALTAGVGALSAGRHGPSDPRPEEGRGVRLPRPREAQEGPGQAPRRRFRREARVHQGHRQGRGGLCAAGLLGLRGGKRALSGLVLEWRGP